MHADHHLGFITINKIYIQEQKLRRRRRRREGGGGGGRGGKFEMKKSIVIAPIAFQQWIAEYEVVRLTIKNDDNEE